MDYTPEALHVVSLHRARGAGLGQVQHFTSMNGEVLHRHRAGHIPDVGQNIFLQAGGRAGHAPGLPIECEEA